MGHNSDSLVKHVKADCKYVLNLDHNYASKNCSLSQFKLAFINVCGLSSKIVIPDFIEFIEKYDIVAMAETKLFNYDNIDVKNYCVFPRIYDNNIKNKSKRRAKHGGVCLLVTFVKKLKLM